jgi:hypothetical protein
MITEDYVSFEIAKLLKEKGYWNMATMLYKENGDIVNYNVPLNNKGFSSTLGVFYEAPTLQMAMKWLREIHKLPINIWYDKEEDTPDDEVWNSEIAIDRPSYILIGSFASYKEACQAAIKYCLENLI